MADRVCWSLAALDSKTGVRISLPFWAGELDPDADGQKYGLLDSWLSLEYHENGTTYAETEEPVARWDFAVVKALSADFPDVLFRLNCTGGDRGGWLCRWYYQGEQYHWQASSQAPELPAIFLPGCKA